jgi:hypothetical protein
VPGVNNHLWGIDNVFSANHAKGGLAAAVLLALGAVSTAQAVDFGDMMNPGKWFGGNKGRDAGPYGPDMPPPGYGYDAPPYGYGGGAPYGYGAPAYGAPGAGYGAPAYGVPPAGAYGQQVPAAPGYAQPAGPGYAQPPAAAPSPSADSEARIRALERRIQELESAQRGSQQPMGAGPMPYQQMPQYRSGPQSGMSGMSGMPGSGAFRPMDRQ